MSPIRIAGISSAVPKSSADLNTAKSYLPESDIERIIANSGVVNRRVAPEGTTAADLCSVAADKLLEELQWARESVDLLIFISQTPDYVLPATSYRLHSELKLPDTCLSFDINLGCSGFTHGLFVVRSLMTAPNIKRALLLCGDTITRISNPSDRSTSLLFGDAGSAAAIEKSEIDSFAASVWGSDGDGYSSLIVPGGAFKNPWTPEFMEAKEDSDGNKRRPVDLEMDGAKIFQFTIKRVPPMVKQVLQEADWSVDDVDSFVFHQANKFIINYLGKKLRLPAEKVPTCLEEYGNTSCASIPMTMVTRLREQLDSPKKLVLIGFGVGLSWSAVALNTDKIVTLPLIEI